jgi:hypothetical protein
MSGEILSINRETARFEPASEFDTPEKLVESTGLTRGEKIAALERWSRQVMDELDATSEGMATNAPTATDTELLDRINAAIAALKKKKTSAT